MSTPLVDLAAFLERGFLQEVNRQWFHPRGLALSVRTKEDGSQHLELLDDSDDREGWIFDWQGMSAEERADSRDKARRVEVSDAHRRPYRLAVLGFWEQPIPEPTGDERPFLHPGDPRLLVREHWDCHLCGAAVLDPSKFCGGPHEGEIVEALRAHLRICPRKGGAA